MYRNVGNQHEYSLSALSLNLPTNTSKILDPGGLDESNFNVSPEIHGNRPKFMVTFFENFSILALSENTLITYHQVRALETIHSQGLLIMLLH